MPIRDIPRGGGEWKARQPKSPLNHGTQRAGVFFFEYNKKLLDYDCKGTIQLVQGLSS